MREPNPAHTPLPAPPPLLAINWRKTALVLGMLCLVGAGLAYGGRFYRRWNYQRIIIRAEKARANGDLRAATLSARHAFHSRPFDPRSARLLADIAESSRSPEAIFWRLRLVQLQPGKIEPLVALAGTALRLGEIDVADQALTMFPVTNRETVVFHELAAGVAIATGQPALAQNHFASALRLAPASVHLRLNLATVQLDSPLREVVREALAALKEMSALPQTRVAAVRALTRYHMNGDPVEAGAYASALATEPGAAFSDQLPWLTLLHRANNPEFAPRLAEVQKRASSKPENVFELIAWMNAQNLSREAIQWTKTLPAPAQAEVPVPVALAESHAQIKDWDGLAELTRSQNWGAIDFLRVAIEARAARENGKKFESQTLWNRAVNDTGGNVPSLYMLARLVDGWGWQSEAEKVWWTISVGNQGQKQALQSLYRRYFDNRDTMGLYRVVKRVYEIEPRNPIARNNVAVLGLLLNDNLAKATSLAEQNLAQFPRDPAIVSTSAFSLYRSGKINEALALLDRLPEAQLREPSVALYYAVILAAAGDQPKARDFIALARRSSQLLPEETDLLLQAQRFNDVRGTKESRPL